MTLKKIVLFCNVILIFPFNYSISQHQITVAPVIGLYIYNSENSLLVMGDENYLLNYGFEFSYKNNSLFGYMIQLDYSYLYSGIDDVLKFVRTGEGGPDPLGYFYSDVSLSLNTLDLSINGKLGNIFYYGFGPSFSIVNRSIIIESPAVDYEDFADRLASFNIGLNGIIEMRIPLSEQNNYWYFYSGLKFRYLYGLFYDEGLRDLSDYNQNFVMTNLAIGIGYNF
jgi:hypothetical protein